MSPSLTIKLPYLELAEELESLGQKILDDIKTYFDDSDAAILSFDSDLVEEETRLNQRNKTPVVYHLDSGAMGLACWARKSLFTFSYYKFLKSKLKLERTDDNSIAQVTRAICLLCPLMPTAWNCRKQLIIDNVITLDEDLRLTSLIVKQKDCIEAFAHRRWCIQTKVRFEGPLSPVFLDQELSLIAEAADRYPRSYSAWGHRRWLMTNYRDDLEGYLVEMALSQKFIERHISDHSAFSYRQFLLLHVGEKASIKVDDTMRLPPQYGRLLSDEMKFLNDMFEIHRNRESLFLHRRFVIKQLLHCGRGKEADLFNEEKQFAREREAHPIGKEHLQSHTVWCKRILNWDL